MLLLLKPWRNPVDDLKHPDETWNEAFSKFFCSASKKTKDLISGIQYFYESRAAADDERERVAEENEIPNNIRQTTRNDDEEDCHLPEDVEEVFTEDGLAKLMASQIPLREELHGRHAVEVAKFAKIFVNDTSFWHTDVSTSISNATGDDLTKLMEWKDQLQVSVDEQNVQLRPPRKESISDKGIVTRLDMEDFDDSHTASVFQIPSENVEPSISAIDPSQLKPDQLRAFNIIVV